MAVAREGQFDLAQFAAAQLGWLQVADHALAPAVGIIDDQLDVIDRIRGVRRDLAGYATHPGIAEFARRLDTAGGHRLMTATQGRFDERAMRRAMRDVADQIGAVTGDAQLLRLTNNAVYALPAERLVIRITRSHGLRDRVNKVLALARWLAELDAPANRLAPGVEQPIRAGDLLATVWEYLPPRQQAPTVSDLGRVLREFHRLGEPPFPLPKWDPVGDARSRVADADGLADDDRRFLLDWCERLAPEVAALNVRAGAGLVHGDAHAGNLLRDGNGRVVLCDLDPTCRGPWQVDLVAVGIGETRFGRRGAHEQLAAAYGCDVTTDPEWPLLREARELKMVAAAVPLLASAPAVADEFDVRLQSIRHSDHHARWTPFADLRQR